MITLLVAPEPFAGDEVVVEGPAYRHLFRARRLAAGRELRIVDGAGNARGGRVVAVDRRRATILLGASLPDLESSVEVRLLVATLRPERAAWLVEKATEIGVSAIRWIATERAPRRYGGATFARFDRIAAAALEQCGRSRLPAVSGIHGFEELHDLATDLARRFVLDPRGRPLATGHGSGAGPVGLLVGPEGGLTDAELTALRDAGWEAVALGERRLRTETAALVGAGLVLAGAHALPASGGRGRRMGSGARVDTPRGEA